MHGCRLPASISADTCAHRNSTPYRLAPSMMTLRKLRSLAAEIGWLNGALYLGGRVLRRFFKAKVIRYYLVAQPVPDKALLPPRRGASIVIRLLEDGDSALAGLPLTGTVLRFRFDQGSICFGAFRDNLIVGCLWLCLGPYDEDEVRCRFQPWPEDRTAWDFDVYVQPEHRAGFVFARLWDEANRYLRNRGIQWSISRISAFNSHSLSSHARLGASRCGSLTALRLGRWQVALCSARPRIHISFGPLSAPCYTVRAPKIPTPVDSDGVGQGTTCSS